MKHLNTEITIAAEPGLIWEVLTDFENYPDWNPFITSIQGAGAVGEELTVQIQPPNGKGMTFKPEIIVFQPNEELKWLGKAGIKGIFDGEHYFKLEKQIDGSTKFLHGERFSGLLVHFMHKTLDKTAVGFELMNKSLKERCEKNK